MTTNTADFLAEQKRRTEAATPGPWCVSDPSPFLPGAQPRLYAPNWKPIQMSESAGLSYVRSSPDGRFIAAARESVPRMIAALEAVIGKHRRQDDDDEPYCGTCFQSPYGYAPWPCPTIRAIEAALGGEGDGAAN